MATEFVKFHGSLRTGSKAALTRAARFIYLELCIFARKENRVQPDGSALVTLSPKGSYAQAVITLVGGAPMEVTRALPALEAEGMIQMETIDDSGAQRRVLRIMKFRRYADRETTQAPVKLAPSSDQARSKLVASSDQARTKLPDAPNHSKDLRALEERREEKRRGEEISAPPPPLRTREATSVRVELSKARDLWPIAEVSDAELEAVATRIATEISDPLNRATSEHVFIARECVTYAREQRARFTTASPVQLLARAEQKVGWLLGDYRSGKRGRRPGDAPQTLDASGIADEIANGDRDLERQRAAAAAQRASARRTGGTADAAALFAPALAPKRTA
jgi:hypothetical protein